MSASIDRPVLSSWSQPVPTQDPNVTLSDSCAGAYPWKIDRPRCNGRGIVAYCAYPPVIVGLIPGDAIAENPRRFPLVNPTPWNVR